MKSLLLVGMLCILLAGFIGMVCADEVEDIVSGHAHNCVLFKSKQVKCFGYNGYGQLGYEDKIPRGNDPGEMGDNLPYVQLSSDNSTYVEKIFSGSDSVCALFNDKRVKCWGYNEEGQLGYGDTESRGNEVDEMNDFLPFVDYGTGKKVLQIIMGYEHICVLRDDGKVVCTGCNCAGALGTETPEDVGDELSDIGDNLVPVNFGTGVTVSSIHSGPTAIHSCAILNESNLKCWGNNEFAQLGTGDTKIRGNALGQMGDKLKFVNLGKKAVLKAVSVGGTHTCVLLGDTSTRCWGLNVFGQIMTGSKSKYIGAKPKDMGKGLKPAVWGKKLYATTLFLEYASTCGLLNDGTVKCFGANDSGQLGQEDRNMRGKTKKTLGDKTKPINFGTNSTLIKLSNGYQFSCVLFVDKKFKCWGNGYGGALGYGDEMERGSFPNSMGSYLPYVDL